MQALQHFREHASEGEYEMALECFKEFETEIKATEKDRKTAIIEGYSWKQIQNELQKEAHLITEILAEFDSFASAKTFGQQSSQPNCDYRSMDKKPNRNSDIKSRYNVKRNNTNRCNGSNTPNNGWNASTTMRKDTSTRKSRLLRGNARTPNKNPNRRNNATMNSASVSKRKSQSNVSNRVPKQPTKLSNNRDDVDETHPPVYRPPTGVDNAMAEMIEHSVIQRNVGVKWDDIAALNDVKRVLREIIILPTIIPEYFKGIRQPFKSVLLFGPPGTGKTLLAKAVASTSQCTFFNVSPSMVISKWRGDSSKIIRILFEMARFYAPSVIFFDEIDSIGSSRSNSGEHEASRQLKSELLIQMDGVHSSEDSNDTDTNDSNDENNNNHSNIANDCDEGSGDTTATMTPTVTTTNGEQPPNQPLKNKKAKRSKHVMVLAATNHPWHLDEALRRRLEKRIYIPLPETIARKQMFEMYLKEISVATDVDFDELASITDGYNGADINGICRDASMISMRKKLAEINVNELANLKHSDIESPITRDDLLSAIKRIKSSVSGDDLQKYAKWFDTFGSL